MSINAISGYNSFDYQSMMNLMQLQNVNNRQSYQSVTAVSRVNSVNSKTKDYTDTTSFLKNYESELTKLETAAEKLREYGTGSVFTDFEVGSSDEAVATVKEEYKIRPDTDITLDVKALAQSQQNVSGSHYSQEQVEAGADMNFEIAGAGGSVNVSISSVNENGTQKTYNQMYQEAAKAINKNSDLGVKASVQNVEGKVSLVLTSQTSGEAGEFTITGDTGAADGLKSAATAAQDAVYTVTQNGTEQTYRSDTNKISLDYGRIEAELKSEGTTNIYSGIDTDKVADAVEDLLESYNSVKSLLEKNESRGSGARAHLQSFERGLADEKTLKALGITYNKDGDLTLDKDKLKESLQNDYEGTKSMLGGQFGIAEKAAAKADSALSDSVQRIVSNDLSSSKIAANSSKNDGELSTGFRYFSNFARSGPYNLSNFYTVGLMLNTLA